jgi:hypothetical protein
VDVPWSVLIVALFADQSAGVDVSPGGRILRQQHFAAGGGDDGVSEIRRGIDAAELCGLEQRVEDGGDLRASA